MIRTIKLTTFESSFTFEVDTEKFPIEDAQLINGFFIDNEARLDNFNNDPYPAALSLYAAILFQIMVEEQPATNMFAHYFNESSREGFIPMHDFSDNRTHHGIKLIDYDYSFDIPEAEDFEWEE